MRLPWNRKYMEIGFHIIVTVLILVVTGGLLFWLPQAKNVISETAGNILAVFSPVLWAIFLSLILEPLVCFWQRLYEKNCSLSHRSQIHDRRVGTAFAYGSVGLFLFLLGGFLAKKIGDTDIQGLTFQITDHIRRAGDILVLLNLKLAEMGILSNVEGILSFWTEQSVQWMEGKVLSLADGIPHMGGDLLNILIGIVAAFYFLMGKEKMRAVGNAFLHAFLGERLTSLIRRLFHEIYSVFSGYLSGQLLDAAIMAVLFSAAFLIVGLPNGIFLGLLSGFSNIIPYFGAVTAFAFAVFSGLLSGTPVKAVYASILILLLQQVDSLFIVPKVVGRRVELHPVMVLFSLAIFGRWLGFWGLLFAVPLGALCKNLLFWLYDRKSN